MTTNTGIEITREQANEIIKGQMSGPHKKCTITYGGKWYDIRHMSDAEIDAFIGSLVGIAPQDLPSASINIRL